MDEQTILKLNQLNQVFYSKIANQFSETRQQPWEGWSKLVPIFKEIFNQKSHIKVLDVGCGNGRLASFLGKTMNPTQIEYLGWDNNQDLLDIAEKNLQKNDLQSVQLTKVDILNKLPVASADLICLFGVLHHIPGREKRLKLLNDLGQQLKPDGVLVFTAWQFDQIPNVFERKIDPIEVGIQTDDLEPNDYLLTWERGTHAVRFCHLLNDEEIDQLVDSLGLAVIETFKEDGKNHLANSYVVLQRSS